MPIQAFVKGYQTPAVAFLIAMMPCWAVAQTGAISSPDVVGRVSDAAVLILSGEGAGRLSSISTGVIVRPNGIILTSYHAIKNAKEVQIRRRTGDVYDQVVLIGVDERRDVAALRISAAGLPALSFEPAQTLKPGETVWIVSNSEGLTWSASKGFFTASQMADEIPGAGKEFRVVQFSAQTSAGASGGALVDERGILIGVITRGMSSGTGFAVPIEAIIGLADGAMNLALGNGSALQLADNRRSPSSVAVVGSDPIEILRSAKTIVIDSKTMYFTPDNLEKELQKEKDFSALALVVVKDHRVADLRITVDRPLFTYTFTYSVVDSNSSVVLNSGRVTAIDGNVAARMISKQLVEAWKKIRVTQTPSEKK